MAASTVLRRVATALGVLLGGALVLSACGGSSASSSQSVQQQVNARIAATHTNSDPIYAAQVIEHEGGKSITLAIAQAPGKYVAAASNGSLVLISNGTSYNCTNGVCTKTKANAPAVNELEPGWRTVLGPVATAALRSKLKATVAFSKGTYDHLASQCVTIVSSKGTEIACLTPAGILTYAKNPTFSLNLQKYTTKVPVAVFTLPANYKIK
jgi:hypothetical protein